MTAAEIKVESTLVAVERHASSVHLKCPKVGETGLQRLVLQVP